MDSLTTPRTDALMRRLSLALKKGYGRHAALAAHLYPKKPRDGATRLSAWLGRRRTPNGEAMLAILEWLDGLENAGRPVGQKCRTARRPAPPGGKHS